MRLKDDNIIVGVALVKKEETSEDNHEDEEKASQNQNVEVENYSNNENNLTESDESAILNTQEISENEEPSNLDDDFDDKD